MGYRPSNEELERFQSFASGKNKGVQITISQLSEAGVTLSKGEASRLLEYLEQFGVMGVTTKSSGYRISDLSRMRYVRTGQRLVYPTNTTDPVIILGTNIEGVELPRQMSFELYDSTVLVDPYQNTLKDESSHIVRASTTIQPPIVLNNHRQRIFSDFFKRENVDVRMPDMDRLIVGSHYILSAYLVAQSAARPLALFHYLVTHMDDANDLDDAAEVIAGYQKSLQSGRKPTRPDVSYDTVNSMFANNIKPFLDQESPKIKAELERMVLDLWKQYQFSEDPKPVQIPKVQKPIETKKRNWFSFFSRLSD